MELRHAAELQTAQKVTERLLAEAESMNRRRAAELQMARDGTARAERLRAESESMERRYAAELQMALDATARAESALGSMHSDAEQRELELEINRRDYEELRARLLAQLEAQSHAAQAEIDALKRELAATEAAKADAASVRIELALTARDAADQVERHERQLAESLEELRFLRVQHREEIHAMEV